MAGIATAEACDSSAPLLSSGDLRVLRPVFSIYGQSRMFSGPIVTLKVFEDNVLARELLETKGEGRVLVVDEAGSTRCALVGNEKEETGEGGEEVTAVDEPSSMSGIFVFNPEIFIGG